MEKNRLEEEKGFFCVAPYAEKRVQISSFRRRKLGNMIEQRNAPGRCCPDFKCAYPSWDGVECPECGKKYAGCVHYEEALKRKQERCADD